jgi:UDP-galactopyranose mutase
MNIDFLIIGAGLTGATIARLLSDSGFSVLVLEYRNEVGGNVADYKDELGMMVHKYGPHYFRTSSDKIWQFVNRFSKFYRFEAEILSSLEDELVNWPLNESYIEKLEGKDWRSKLRTEPAENFEQACLRLMPEKIYEKFIKEYNEKQWGVPCSSLDASLCKRFDVRADSETRLKPKAKYQGLPIGGYSNLVKQMLKNIKVVLNFNFLKNRDTFRPKYKTIYTGPIDSFFNNEFGKLKYRAQKRKKITIDQKWYQKKVQVNYPLHRSGKHIRIIEWKHLQGPDFSFIRDETSITIETPFSPSCFTDYEYPFPSLKNRLIYEKYKEKSNELQSVVFAGRLGEYRYYDMDQAIGRAMKITNEMLK